MGKIQFLLGICILQSLCQRGLSNPMSEEENSNHELRCQLSDIVCQVTCFLGGQQSGICVPNDKGGKACICLRDGVSDAICGIKEEKIAGHTCAGYCQISGRQTGNCEGEKCECAKERFIFDREARCLTNEVCSMYCQLVRGAPTGSCQGPNNWNCVCE